MSLLGPAGFVASSGFAGIRGEELDGAGQSGPDQRDDLALLATDDGRPVAAAAVLTSNLAAAAPVRVTAEHLLATGGRAAAVILNSGNANAATGAAGYAHAKETCALVAEGLGVPTEEVLVCSTGLIGRPLAMDRIRPVIGPLLARRSSSTEAAQAAARAILTTDTRMKETLVEMDRFRVGGMAKGAAMLAPDMVGASRLNLAPPCAPLGRLGGQPAFGHATMLAVLTTDAQVAPDELEDLLEMAVAQSFNLMSVDGCTSTNDTVIVLASGRAGPVDSEDLAESLTRACSDLAGQMVADAEGATKSIRVRVQGATSQAEAAIGARKVADSLLVKCSVNGADPYWGRVVSELASAGIHFDIDRVSISYGGEVVCRGGVACPHDEEAVATHMSGAVIEIGADLGLGLGRSAMLAADLGVGYVQENRGTS